MNIISAIRTRLAIRGLKSMKYKRQRKAIKVLAQIGVDSAEALINFINSSYRYGQPKKVAVEALGLIGDKSVVAPLIVLLKDPWDDMRKEAIIALGKLNDKDAVLPLIEALEYDQTRSCAIEALQKINDPRASDPLRFAKQAQTQAIKAEEQRNIERYRTLVQERYQSGGVCVSCGKTITDRTVEALFFNPELSISDSSTYDCKSCGAIYCLDCMSRLKKQKHKCLNCEQNIGW